MPAIRTEELFSMVREALMGGEVRTLVPALREVLESTRESWQQFLLVATEDPEMPTDVREAIAGGLEAYIDCLEAMSEAASADDTGRVASLLTEAERCVLAVRSAQDVHKTTLAEGPTPFPYLNRLLIQYQAVREGGDSQRLLVLLQSGNGFLLWLRKELESRSGQPADRQAVFHLQQLLEALKNAAVECDAQLPEIGEEIAELASHLAAALSEPPLEAEQGPTALPAVNSVLQALSECSDQIEEYEFLLSLIDQCRDSLRGQVPITSPAEVVTALKMVISNLDRMEESLKHTGDFEELVRAASELEASANKLGHTLGGGAQESFAEQTEGLPVFFRSILEPAYQFLLGAGDADTVFAASDHLSQSASDMQRSVAALDGSDPRAQAMQEAVELMGEAAQMLLEVAQTGNQKALEVAHAILSEAGALVKKLV